MGFLRVMEICYRLYSTTSYLNNEHVPEILQFQKFFFFFYSNGFGEELILKTGTLNIIRA